MAGTLFVVATPIGNREDLTGRAIRTLREVSVIACEDTRQTRKLLDPAGIETPVISYYEQNEAARAAELVARMERGESVALVSDAGTPLISDPGYRLVRLALDRGLSVVPIPGPSALATALSASGLATDTFRFGGFLPPKSARRRAELARWVDSPDTLIYYEAPHRIVETLADVLEVFGPDRAVVVARELTKLHEEFTRGAASSVWRNYSQRESIKGEITLLIGKREAAAEAPPREQLREDVERLVEEGVPRMSAIKQVAQRHSLGKREVYKALEEEQ